MSTDSQGQLDRSGPVEAAEGDLDTVTHADTPRSCPACSTATSSDRELCPACGVDLETGESLPVAPTAAGTLSEPAVVIGPSGSRWWIPVGAAAVTVGAVLAGLAIAGVGPFASDSSVPAVELDDAVYDEERFVLELTDIATATTAAPSGGRQFSAVQMVDDDPDTAWLSDGPDQARGVGEIIDLFLAEPAWVELLIIRNGDQIDSDSYAASGRIQRALVTLDGDVSFVVNFLDLGRSAQAVELSAPILSTTMRIEVLETFPGDTHSAVAISDVELMGRPANADDAALARERALGTRAANG